VDRRKFVKTTAISAAGLSFLPHGDVKAKEKTDTGFFGVSSAVEDNPDAVFILRTDVDVKTNSSKIYNIGKNFAKSILVSKEAGAKGAIPVTNLIAIKPNITRRYNGMDGYTVEGTMGIVTDVNFVAGFVDRFKEFGIIADNIHLIETNYDETDLKDGGYINFVKKAGIRLDNYSDGVGGIPENKIVWKNVVGGTYFKKLPYIFPVNAPDSWLLNIAKLKAHGMGITSCAKNLQGTIVKNYQQHCRALTSGNPEGVPESDLVFDRESRIKTNYERHKEKIPRWDKPGRYGGIWQETWATRCLDNNMTLNAGLHIIEGIYGRDGNFINGPSLGDDNPKGLATDYMSNVVVFGKNPFYVDIIGHWLAGHEPGNFGLFHLAIERGLASVLNPMDIPLYEWKTDGKPVKAKLTDFNRTPLKTYYLQRDYDGQTEKYWHLCNEPYDYNTTDLEEIKETIPSEYVLEQNYPNPFNPTTTISFKLKEAGHTNLTLFDLQGRKIATLINKTMPAGKHKYVLDASIMLLQLVSGTYFYRLESGDFVETKKMVLLK
jgi:hypothetical protein